MTAVPSTSTASQPVMVNPENLEVPYSPRVRSSVSIKRPRTVSPRALEALKVKVSQDAMSASSTSVSTADSPLDLSCRPCSSSFPNTTFSFHPVASTSASSEVSEAPSASTSFLVAPRATLLREMMPEERSIKLVFSSDRPDLPFPRVELLEVPTTGSPTPSTSTSSQ
jgi:hypothetical protein